MDTQQLDTDFYIMLGGVIEAYHNRAFVRAQIDAAQAETRSAQADVRSFGMYEDCGDGYQEDYAAAKAVEAYAIKMKVKAEKHFKARKMAFFEAYPHHGKAVLRKHISTE